MCKDQSGAWYIQGMLICFGCLLMLYDCWFSESPPYGAGYWSAVCL